VSTLREARARADARLQAGDLPGALRRYVPIMQAVPLDFETRMRVADALYAAGDVDRAAKVYIAVTRFSTLAGFPLKALVSCKLLMTIDPQLGMALDQLAGMYGAGSSRLGRGIRVAPVDDDMELPAGTPEESAASASGIAAEATKIAAETEGLQAYPETVPPIPLFSDLSKDAFARMLHLMQLRRVKAGEMILNEGEPGTSFFVVARGTVRVFGHDTLGKETELALLHDGAIFGEMALVSAAPRSASVQATREGDLLEFPKESLMALSGEIHAVADALDKFTRERLLNNLLATCPVFKPFDRQQKLELVRRFSAHDVAPGTVMIAEGHDGRGLYLLLSGDADVTKVDGAEKVLIGNIKSGDAFGEISLLHGTKTTATVTAARQSTVLFLAREYFQKLVAAIPSVKTYFETLSEERLLDTRMALARDDSMELGEEDVVLV